MKFTKKGSVAKYVIIIMLGIIIAILLGMVYFIYKLKMKYGGII